ncbi:MAG TPA: DUF4097 family beta strand repeat-containing protein [Pyrinomonadaceae bacterium]|nr:DUF4097 family beta strand repeat-containing protein [Pyrinomonadaceae bacterium]
MLRKVLARMVLTCVVFGLVASAAAAQAENPRPSLACRDQENYSGDSARARHCEIKEQTLPATGGTLNVDGMKNGGISVKGWERNEILVRYRLQTHAPTQGEADALASQIRVTTAGGQIRAAGPEPSAEARWDVGYELFVPRESNLSLQTHNGGISLSNVRGRINFAARNGGVSLKALGGNVTGETVNGGLHVELTGSNWEGEGLNVRTTNGGLSITVPDNYSAHLETGTVNGGLVVNPSIAEVTRKTKQLSLDLGSGGTNLRIHTTNGGVSIKRRESR